MADRKRATWRRPASLMRRFTSQDQAWELSRDDEREFAEQSRSRYIGTMAPALDEVPDILDACARRLAESGAVDEGSRAVIDPTLQSWVEQWCTQVDAEHDARQSVLRTRELRAAAYVNWSDERVDLLTRQLEEVEDYLAQLTALPGAEGRPRPRIGWLRRRQREPASEARSDEGESSGTATSNDESDPA